MQACARVVFATAEDNRLRSAEAASYSVLTETGQKLKQLAQFVGRTENNARKLLMMSHRPLPFYGLNVIPAKSEGARTRSMASILSSNDVSRALIINK